MVEWTSIKHYEVLSVQLADLQTEPGKLFDGGQLYFSRESDENELAHVLDVIGAD